VDVDTPVPVPVKLSARHAPDSAKQSATAVIVSPLTRGKNLNCYSSVLAVIAGVVTELEGSGLVPVPVPIVGIS
jgi:hypothetical protein